MKRLFLCLLSFSVSVFVSQSDLENDELPGSPDMCPSSQPVYLIPHHAVDEEQEEDGVDDESTLHHPHGDSVDVLQGGGRALAGWGGEGAGYKERK